MDNTCSTCGFNFRWEDNHDANSETGYGLRIGYRCSNRDTPVVATVVVRGSNDNKEETCYIHTFGCNFWEAKSE